MFLKSMIVLGISEVSGGDKDTTVDANPDPTGSLDPGHGETRWINGTIFNHSIPG